MRLIFTVTIFLGVYGWLISEKTPRHIVVLSGCLALLLGRVFTIQEALHYVNWNTLLLLLVLFLFVGILSSFGFFQALAFALTRRFQNYPAALFFVLPLLAGGLSMGINNITVMIFMTPLTLEICRHISLKPTPLIVGEVCCANMMGAATLTGAPPNLLMASTLGYGFNRVALHMAPLVGIGTLVFMTVHYAQHRRALHRTERTNAQILTALPPEKFDIDWQTLLFFMGLFILVGALDRVGIFQRMAELLNSVRKPLVLALAMLWLAAVASAFVDNIPMALAMAYLIKNLTILSPGFPSGILVWAALIGLTLGGNMTPIGASPNLVAYSFLEKKKIKVGWKTWGKLTIPATLSALAASSLWIGFTYKMGWY